jgi:hypothetical protein
MDSNMILPHCNLEEGKLPREKKSDLMDLLNYIPPAFHDFYINLATADDADDTS